MDAKFFSAFDLSPPVGERWEADESRPGIIVPSKPPIPAPNTEYQAGTQWVPF